MCGTVLPRGSRIFWERSAPVLCPDCACEAKDSLHGSIFNGPGASAARMFERKKAGEKSALRSGLGSSRRMLRSSSGDLKESENWLKGAVGERKVGSVLNRLESRGFGFALHDRALPGSSANIDHMWVTDKEVWVVDAKAWEGSVYRPIVPLFPTVPSLTFQEVNRDSEVVSLERSVELVEAYLSSVGFNASVRGCLCFTKADFGILPLPFTVRGIKCTYPFALQFALPRQKSVSDARSLRTFLEDRFPEYI